MILEVWRRCAMHQHFESSRCTLHRTICGPWLTPLTRATSQSCTRQVANATVLPWSACGLFAAAFRHVNRVTTWETVKDHLATRGKPDWSAALSALRTLKASGVPLASGVFYPAQVKEYRWSPKQSWKTASGMDMPDKIVLAWQVMWSAVPRTEIRSHAKKPSRDTFKACYNAWETKMDDLTRGMFGAYFMKCMLDLLCFTGHIEDRHLSCWPSECDGYSPALTKLFGARNSSLRLQMLWWLYHVYGGSCHGGKLCFAAFSMHLCWWSRSRAA